MRWPAGTPDTPIRRRAARIGERSSAAPPLKSSRSGRCARRNAAVSEWLSREVRQMLRASDKQRISGLIDTLADLPLSTAFRGVYRADRASDRRRALPELGHGVFLNLPNNSSSVQGTHLNSNGCARFSIRR